MKWQKILIMFLTITLWTCSKKSEHLEKAQAFLEIRRYDYALEQAEMAIQENPRSVEAHVTKGRAFLFNGDFDAAEEAFDTAILLETGVRNKIAQIYFDTGMDLLEKRMRYAKYCFGKAIEKQPEIGNSISEVFFNRAINAIEISPKVNQEQINLLELSIEYCDPNLKVSQKEKAADLLFQEAIKRKNKSFFKTSASLAFKALRFDPLKQEELLAHILDISYELIERGTDTDYWQDKLYRVHKIDNRLEKDPKFLYYYFFKPVNNPQNLDVGKAEKYVIDFPGGEFTEDVIMLLIRYYHYKLDFAKADFYIAQYKSDFQNGRHIAEVSKIEKELKELH